MTARHNNESRRTALRLLTGVMLAAGVLAATSRPANAATTATFNNGALTVFGDAVANTIDDQPQRGRASSWSTAGRFPSGAARRRSPTPR